MKLVCHCGEAQEVPALEPGVPRVLFCPRCRERTRVLRRADGKVAATRLVRPEVHVTCACGKAFSAVPPDAGGTISCPACGRAFEAKKVRRHAPEVTAHVGVSAAPGKNQDRALWNAAEGVGAVADGVTSSLRSEAAADMICREAPALFEGELAGPLASLRDRLLLARSSLAAHPLGADELAAVGGDPRAAAQARAIAFQATCLAFRVRDQTADAYEVGVVRCGDSSFLALGREGVVAAVGVRGRDAGAGAPGRHILFADRAGGTYCLPDGAHTAESCRVTVPRSAWMIGATDGFFDSFQGSAELFAWLEWARPALGDPSGRATLLAGLHERLAQGMKGDDDIAFVIVEP